MGGGGGGGGGFDLLALLTFLPFTQNKVGRGGGGPPLDPPLYHAATTRRLDDIKMVTCSANSRLSNSKGYGSKK